MINLTLNHELYCCQVIISTYQYAIFVHFDTKSDFLFLNVATGITMDHFPSFKKKKQF